MEAGQKSTSIAGDSRKVAACVGRTCLVMPLASAAVDAEISCWAATRASGSRKEPTLQVQKSDEFMYSAAGCFCSGGDRC